MISGSGRIVRLFLPSLVLGVVACAQLENAITRSVDNGSASGASEGQPAPTEQKKASQFPTLETAKPRTAPAGAFGGDFHTGDGDIVLVDNGATVTSTTMPYKGKVDCVVSGDAMYCEWVDSGGRGLAILQLQEDGDLVGHWGYNDDEPTRDYRFRKGLTPESSGSSSSSGSWGSSGSSSSSSASGSTGGCSKDSDCTGSGKMCESGACVAKVGMCSFDSDCGGAACRKNRCANSAYGSCDLDSHCGKGGKCSSHKCR